MTLDFTTVIMQSPVLDDHFKNTLLQAAPELSDQAKQELILATLQAEQVVFQANQQFLTDKL